MDSCITQLKAQGSSRTCNESKEEEEELLNLQDMRYNVSENKPGLTRFVRPNTGVPRSSETAPP